MYRLRFLFVIYVSNLSNRNICISIRIYIQLSWVKNIDTEFFIRNLCVKMCVWVKKWCSNITIFRNINIVKVSLRLKGPGWAWVLPSWTGSALSCGLSRRTSQSSSFCVVCSCLKYIFFFPNISVCGCPHVCLPVGVYFMLTTCFEEYLQCTCL